MELYDQLIELQFKSPQQVLEIDIDILFRLSDYFNAGKYREEIYSVLQHCFNVQEQLRDEPQYFDLTDGGKNIMAAVAAPSTTASSTSAAAAAAVDSISPSSTAAAPFTAASSSAAASAAECISPSRATAAVIPATAIASHKFESSEELCSSQQEINVGVLMIKNFDECICQALQADTMLTSLVNNIIKDDIFFNLLHKSDMTFPKFLNKLGKLILIKLSVITY
jgi:hypothetical protein